ncbi:YkgJ family cysteine cluster protein [Vibrio sp.]|nr:YkgJ family cysteine cluster protein [Vibrio sp.]
MECRLGCGACCIAPSISSLNKPANVRCQYLNDENLCSIFGKKERPAVCHQFKAEHSICGDTNKEAMDNLIYLEKIT